MNPTVRRRWPGSAWASLRCNGMWRRSGKCSACGLTTTAADRKSTRLNSSHMSISYAVFCLKKKKLKDTSYMAVGFYVAKYVNKKSDMDLAAKGLGSKEWNNSLKTKLSLLPKELFRIRMSRNFGMKMLTMTNLYTECLIQLTKLGYDATPFFFFF